MKFRRADFGQEQKSSKVGDTIQRSVGRTLLRSCHDLLRVQASSVGYHSICKDTNRRLVGDSIGARLEARPLSFALRRRDDRHVCVTASVLCRPHGRFKAAHLALVKTRQSQPRTVERVQP
jgi:hypothetical protein